MDDTSTIGGTQAGGHWAIVPWLNSPEMTWQAVMDLLAQTLPTRVILVGQGVSTEDRAWMDEKIDVFRPVGPPDVLPVYYQPALPSLSALWNRTLRMVWELGGESALVVNNDVRLHPQTYQYLQRVQQRERALFVSAVGVKEAGFALRDPKYVYTDYDFWDAHSDDPDRHGQLLSRGGPDFSCFLITEDCHTRFPFDEAFIPAYHEDLDYHRRLMLECNGHRIFSVNLPFWHLASQTLNRSTPEQQARFRAQFDRCRQVYIEKWGGPPNQETFWTPHGLQDEELRRASGPTPPVTTPDLQAWWQAHPQGGNLWGDPPSSDDELRELTIRIAEGEM